MKTYILQFSESDNKWYTIFEFSSYEELLKFIARNDDSVCLEGSDRYHRFFQRNLRAYLDNINMNGNDLIVYHHYWDEYKKEIYVRPYIFMDEKNRILDPRKSIPQILKYRKEWIKECENRSYSRFPKTEFRREPVPGTFHNEYNNFEKGHYIPQYYRHIKFGKLIKEQGTEEFEKFGRKSRKIHCTWDFYETVMSRSGSKSWKDKTRCKKQWEKNLPKK